MPILILRPTPTTDLTSVEAMALLDTGATISGVAKHVVRQLDLPRVGRRPLMSAQGLGQVERFLFRFGLKISDSPSAFPYIFRETMGFEIVDGSSFDALIGMDILSQCDFEMRRDGTCRLSFG